MFLLRRRFCRGSLPLKKPTPYDLAGFGVHPGKKGDALITVKNCAFDIVRNTSDTITLFPASVNFHQFAPATRAIAKVDDSNILRTCPQELGASLTEVLNGLDFRNAKIKRLVSKIRVTLKRKHFSASSIKFNKYSSTCKDRYTVVATRSKVKSKHFSRVDFG